MRNEYETVRSPDLTIPHSESLPTHNSLVHLRLHPTHTNRWNDEAETPSTLRIGLVKKHSDTGHLYFSVIINP